MSTKGGVNPTLATRQINIFYRYHQTIKANGCEHRCTHVHVLKSPSLPLEMLIISNNEGCSFHFQLIPACLSNGTCALQNA